MPAAPAAVRPDPLRLAAAGSVDDGTSRATTGVDLSPLTGALDASAARCG